MEKLLIVLKKGLIILMLLFLGVSPSLAQNQTIENQNSYVGLNIEKTPEQADSKQKIKNERSFFNINIIVNGKVKECQSDNKD